LLANSLRFQQAQYSQANSLLQSAWHAIWYARSEFHGEHVMTVRHLTATLAMVLALAACGTDTYESVSKDIDELMAENIALTTENKAEIAALREKAEKLQSDGKSEDALQALEKARAIIKYAKDADLLRKSEG
jgi:voltage-gated potassium channel Kch